MELVKVENSAVIELYQAGEGLDPLIESVRDTVDAFEHDLSTAKGRAATASLAAKVSKAKTFLDGLGKDLVSGWKEQAKVVDTCRKRMREDLDKLRDQARQPLTEWEEIEAQKLAAIQNRIDEISVLGEVHVADDSKDCKDKLDTVEALIIDDAYGERKTEAFAEKERTRGVLKAAIERLEKAEAEKIELEKLRKESQERAKAEAEEQLRKEGEQRAKKEAEAKMAAERARIEAETNARMIASQKAEAEAFRAKEEAEKAIEQAKREAAEAKSRAEAELEAKRAQEVAAEEERAENTQHNKKLKTQSKNALLELGISEADAVKVIIAICEGKIPNIAMRF